MHFVYSISEAKLEIMNNEDNNNDNVLLVDLR